jgi:hypothetical protein
VYGVDPWARDGFSREVASLESALVPEYLSEGTSMEEFPLGDAEDEIKYRKWCLRNRLFLNPLNDLVVRLSCLDSVAEVGSPEGFTRGEG